jgi:GT2 family glycosyltransferase
MNNKRRQVSLIVSTYNRPEALALCLQSIAAQTVLPDEVIIGDDGSTEATAALGCNMSFWREDFIRVNGYDEYYEGWGAEDSDLASRLLNSGVRRLALKFAAIAFHLWHKESPMDNKDRNYAYLYSVVARQSSRCLRGVDRYLRAEQ